MFSPSAVALLLSLLFSCAGAQNPATPTPHSVAAPPVAR
jgi:hypothetical protein